MHMTTLKRIGFTILLIGTGVSCRDTPIDPADDELTLEIREAGVSFEEATIQQGSTLQLTATFLNSAGTPRNGAGVTW